MKTKEEIERLALQRFPIEMVVVFSKRGKVDKNKERRKIFIETYTQCQKDMVDKKYTEVDLENAFNSGRGYGVPDNIKDFNSFINSLNKQY